MTDTDSKNAIERFLTTGEYDLLFRCFDGANTLDRINRGHGALVTALQHEVRSRAHGRSEVTQVAVPSELQSFAREKVSPMVRGLFPRKEVDPVVTVLENSVVFLTSTNIADVLLSEDLSTAWDLANLYLYSFGAELLSIEAPTIVGLSAETKCYVSTAYFTETDPFADFVVHEAAHVFHNVKRRTIGIPSTRNKEWLLPIVYSKRETFTYACEAYSRIISQSVRPIDRQENLERHKSFCPADDRVDLDEYHDILREAVSRRNGWRSILDRCSLKK